MQFGLNIPPRGPLAGRDAILAIAAHAEALGFARLTVPDHIVVPRDIGSRYPYAEDGAFPGAAGEFADPLVIMAFLAAATSRIGLMTSVLVVPHRPAVATAKMLATIDALCDGRVTLGVGAGWMREEFEAIGAPPFVARGRVTDEYIAAFRELWCADDPRFDGEYVRFADIVFLPKPVQRPIPVWSGGESPAALRRAGRVADGWYPVGSNPRYPLDTLDRYDARLARVKRIAEESGRDPESLHLAYWAMRHRAGERLEAAGGGARCLFSGSDEEVLGDIAAFAGRGVRSLNFNLVGGTLSATRDRMSRFAEAIMAKAGAES